MPKCKEENKCQQFDNFRNCKDGKECTECKSDNDPKNAKNAQVAITGKKTKVKNAEKTRDAKN